MEAPSVEEAQREIGTGVTVLGVAWAGDSGSYTDFVARHGLTFPQIDDTAAEVFTRFGVPGQPAWVFIDGEGTVTRRLGAMSDEDLAATLDTLAQG